jgi:hypothetical protein
VLPQDLRQFLVRRCQKLIGVESDSLLDASLSCVVGPAGARIVLVTNMRQSLRAHILLSCGIALLVNDADVHRILRWLVVGVLVDDKALYFGLCVVVLVNNSFNNLFPCLVVFAKLSYELVTFNA